MRPRTQAKYRRVVAAGARHVPVALHSDLVRLAKLARVGQRDLLAAVRASCPGGASAAEAFDALSAAQLEETVSRAVVNATAIAAAICSGGGSCAQTGAAGDGSAPLYGKLMGHGGIGQCRGTYEALATSARVEVETDDVGVFSVDTAPGVGRLRFSASLPGSACRDGVTGAAVRFPFVVHLPPVASTAVTPIALLTVPAADDPAVARRHGGHAAAAGGAPPYLWAHAYALVGYNADALGADFLSYVGDSLRLGHPWAAAIAGTNAQLMALFATALEALEPLLGPRVSTDDVAAAIVHATYAAISGRAEATTGAAGGSSAVGDGSAVLSEAGALSGILMDSCRRGITDGALRPCEELRPLCDAVADALAAGNARVQTVVADARRAASKGNRAFDGIGATVQIAAIAGAQQSDMLGAVARLAAHAAAAPTASVAAAVEAFADELSVEALQKYVGARAGGVNDMLRQIRQHHAFLGRPVHELHATRRRGNLVAVIAGSLLGAGVFAGLVAAAVITARRRHGGGGAAGAPGGKRMGSAAMHAAATAAAVAAAASASAAKPKLRPSNVIRAPRSPRGGPLSPRARLAAGSSSNSSSMSTSAGSPFLAAHAAAAAAAAARGSSSVSAAAAAAAAAPGSIAQQARAAVRSQAALRDDDGPDPAVAASVAASARGS